MKEIILDKDKLEQLYVVEKKTTREIAAIMDCSYSTVNKELRRHGIQVRERNIFGSAGKEDLKEDNKGPIDCNKQGKDCVYRFTQSGLLHGSCNYCEITGTCRMCDPHECTKYIPKSRARYRKSMYGRVVER